MTQMAIPRPSLPRGSNNGTHNRPRFNNPPRAVHNRSLLDQLPSFSRQEACDLCDANAFRLLSQRDRDGRPLDTVICEQCGLVCHAELPDPIGLTAYYQTAYRQQYHGQRAPRPHRVIRAWKAGRHYLKLLRPFLPAGGHLCEVGAGLGANVQAFSEAGFRAWGLEPGYDYASYARNVLRADVRLGQLDDLPPNECLDVVLLIHVIEHLRSPRAALHRIRGALRPWGLLYIECPDLSTPHSAPHRCFHPAHIYDFTSETLTRLALRCGFRVVHSFRSDAHVSVLLQRSDEQEPDQVGGGAARTLQGLNRFSR